MSNKVVERQITMIASYSRKTLIEKLGIKEGLRVVVVNPPRNYMGMLGKLPTDVLICQELKGTADVIHFFTTERKELEDRFSILKHALSQDGVLWISWPKVSS